MNLSHALIEEHSRAQAERIAAYVVEDPQRLENLIDLLLGEDSLLSQRAAWVLGIVLEVQPDWVQPHMGRLLDAFENRADLHQAVLRNTLRSIVGQAIPEDQQGAWLDLCLSYVQDPKCPAAIRVHAMQIAFDLSRVYPELGQELRLILEEHLPDGTAGFQNRAKKLIAKLPPPQGRG